MDETNTKWFRWLADHSGHIFWGLWGAGIGATGAVFIGVVDGGPDFLKIYVSVLTAVIGATLAMVGTRAVDAFTDRRKRIRIISVAQAEVLTLGGALKSFRALRLKAQKAERNSHNVSTILSLAQHVVACAGERPDLKDILENHDDVVMAGELNTIFRSIDATFASAAGSISKDQRAQVVEDLLTDDDLDRKIGIFIETCGKAYAHLKQMLNR